MLNRTEESMKDDVPWSHLYGIPLSMVNKEHGKIICNPNNKYNVT